MDVRASRGLAVAALATLWLSPARAGGGVTTLTTTTRYAYNADGARTAVTTQIGTHAALTRYLTWDNFIPAAGAPTTGTVSAANGNLLGVGTEPGADGRFSYDVRDRLTGCGAAGEPVASYAYHPASLLASSTVASGDALRFYYDNTGTPRMVNTVQPSTGMAASFLGPVRYLSDGTEQVLLNPRKDVAALYDAAAQTLSPYAYDPYGAPTDPTIAAPSEPSSPPAHHTSAAPHLRPPEQYDLTDNPFRYAGEYRDAACDAYYLRARWYLPAQETFLARDPADLLHRYSYTAGNPVGRVDPTGLRFTGMDFSRDADMMFAKLTPGPAAYIEPVLPIWGQVLGGIELVGLLPTFWHRPTARKVTELSLIGASIATEVAGEFSWFDRLAGTATRALAARTGADVVLGSTQTVAESYRHGRVDVPALVQGIEIMASGIFWGRVASGIGYRASNLSTGDLDVMGNAHASDAASRDEALIFRVRSNRQGAFTSPLMEQFTVGNYHEAVMSYSDESLWFADAQVRGGEHSWEISWSRDTGDLSRPSNYLPSRASRQLALSGRAHLDAVDGIFRGELSELQQQDVDESSADADGSQMQGSGRYSNNCQRSVARIRNNIASFSRAPRVSAGDVE